MYEFCSCPECAATFENKTNWEEFFHEHIINASELIVLENLNNSALWAESTTSDYMARSSSLVIETLLTVAPKLVGSPEALKFITTCLLILEYRFSDNFSSILRNNPKFDTRWLFPVNDMADVCMQRMKLYLLSILLSLNYPPALNGLPLFFDAILHNLSTNTQPASYTLALQRSLSSKKMRSHLFNNPRLTACLIDILRTSSSTQLQYQVLFCLWTLTFSNMMSNELERKHGMTSILVQYIRSSHKEKVTRMCLSMIRNLLTRARKLVMPILIGNKFLFMLDTITSKGYTDAEIGHDSDFLREEIEAALESLRFDSIPLIH